MRIGQQLPGSLPRHFEFPADVQIRRVDEADGLPRHRSDTFEKWRFFSCFFRLFLASESLIDGLLRVLGVKSSQDHFWRFQLKTNLNSEPKGLKKILGRRR